MRPSPNFLALILLSSPLHAHAQDRDAKVRNDRQAFGASRDWIYNDLDEGLWAAKGSNKPLLVVFRRSDWQSITETGLNTDDTTWTFAPGPTPNTVRASEGKILTAPGGWILLPPGDAGLTRRVKAAGDHWIVREKVGRRMFSRGVWAASATIDRIRAELEAERSTEGYAKKQEAAARRRGTAQAEYVEDFHGAVLAFLAFHSSHAELAGRLARAVADHATPVGSGTVARTKRIPVEQRAEAAVVAWMRHQTTGYDGMTIPKAKGERREVRRMLARRSQELLQRYRHGEPIGDDCPLRRALAVED
nr:DUF2293 domain-containing protein [Paludisphaera borealis]